MPHLFLELDGLYLLSASFLIEAFVFKGFLFMDQWQRFVNHHHIGLIYVNAFY